MKKSSFLFLSVICAMAFTSGFMTKGSFAFVCILLSVACLIALGLITSGILVLVLKTTGKQAVALRTSKHFGFLAVLLVLAHFGGVTAHQIWEYELSQYVSNALPRLDEFRNKCGRFPSSIEEAGLPKPPHELRYEITPEGDRFEFKYDDPAELMGGMYFESIERKWNHWS